MFACNWPGPRYKDFNLAELRAEAQLLHLPEHLPTPTLKSLPFRLWNEDQDRRIDPPQCKWINDIIPVPESSTPSDLVIGSLALGQRRAMSAYLQVFTEHCFCGEYSQRMRPTAGDVTTCPCTYTHAPIPMTELDRHGDPLPKVEGDRDLFRGRTGTIRPLAALAQDVSSDSGFERLMAEHLDPHRTRLRLPLLFDDVLHVMRVRCLDASSGTLARSDALALRPESPPRDRWRRECDARALRPDPSPQYVLHSAPHILFDCPLVSVFRSRLLTDSPPRYLFWTVKGASALALFSTPFSAPCLHAWTHLSLSLDMAPCTFRFSPPHV